MEYFREEDVTKALQAPVCIDGKVVKCSRVILKQEAKSTQLAEAKPSKGFGVPNSVQSSKKQSQTKPQKCPKAKKHPKITLCRHNDDNGYHDDATKENSHCSSCEKTKQSYNFKQCSSHFLTDPRYEQANEYQPGQYPEMSSGNNLFHRQQVYPEETPQNTNFTALNYGWRLHDQYGSTGIMPGSLYDREIVQRKQSWYQSNPYSSSNFTYQSELHYSQNTVDDLKASHYRMF